MVNEGRSIVVDDGNSRSEICRDMGIGQRDTWVEV